MTQDSSQLSKAPTPDKAEDNAFFPSPYSLSQYTAPKTDFNVLIIKMLILVANGKY